MPASMWAPSFYLVGAVATRSTPGAFVQICGGSREEAICRLAPRGFPGAQHLVSFEGAVVRRPLRLPVVEQLCSPDQHLTARVGDGLAALRKVPCCLAGDRDQDAREASSWEPSMHCSARRIAAEGRTTENGGVGGNRTLDQRIKSPMLYRLSYHSDAGSGPGPPRGRA